MEAAIAARLPVSGLWSEELGYWLMFQQCSTFSEYSVWSYEPALANQWSSTDIRRSDLQVRLLSAPLFGPPEARNGLCKVISLPSLFVTVAALNN